MPSMCLRVCARQACRNDPDIDIWRAALQATTRADELLFEGNVDGAEAWKAITAAIAELQADKPADGEAVH